MTVEVVETVTLLAMLVAIARVRHWQFSRHQPKTHSIAMPDSAEYPLTPSIGNLVDYATTLDNEGHCITIEWATNEIKNHLFSYVRVGLVADAVRRYRKYEDTSDFKLKCRTFSEYCRKVLGKSGCN